MDSQTMRVLCFASLIFLVGCSHTPIPQSSADDTYQKSLAAVTKHVYGYNGVNNIFEYKSSLITHKIADAQIRIQANDYQWPESKINEERMKVSQDQSNRTRFFFDFFTPDAQLDDLTSAQSVWRLYLNIEGKRLTPLVEKMVNPFPEIQSIYSYHNKWSTPYVLNFSIPTDEVERFGAKLTITGPYGTEEVEFPKSASN